jgi:hypothetical protein
MVHEAVGWKAPAVERRSGRYHWLTTATLIRLNWYHSNLLVYLIKRSEITGLRIKFHYGRMGCKLLVVLTLFATEASEVWPMNSVGIRLVPEMR